MTSSRWSTRWRGCGEKLVAIDVGYETYGQLDEVGDNTVLICQALSGNATITPLLNRCPAKA